MSIADSDPLSPVDSSVFDDDPPKSQGVGLSNPHLSQERRKMLDLVNRLHSTG